ncbi:MAG: ABC transporter ATP-binding protein [SAR202 cluster bacterium]|nr:ABC transporter ATP-binding protein [SAR202 cluster bacterium]|tara:strand:- start:1295 stop:2191 length:897 start_codon:yes stop_codon:yes gene_type:complete
MNNIIEISNVTKNYGRVKALSNLNLSVEEGEIFGFLGPNGAGKTTALRILVDYIRSSSGTCKIFGMDTVKDSTTIKKNIGYLPGNIQMYKSMKAIDLLKYFANLRGLTDLDYARDLAKRFDSDIDIKIGNMSKGNQQKIGLIQAMMHKPALLILDEPTSGLDPLIQEQFFNMMEEIRDSGKTIFMSSHILSEVERICDRVSILKSGTIVATENIESLKIKSAQEFEIHFDTDIKKEVFMGLKEIRDLKINGNKLKCTVIGTPNNLLKLATQYTIKKIVTNESNLETTFLSFYEDQAII